MTVETAAGGVVWREVDGERHVAVVHRPRYDDWSLPKGKVHRSERESDLLGAVREVFEETGLRVVTQQRLEPVRYSLPDREKSVTYWTMLARDGNFTANDETDELQWWTVPHAASGLTYHHDRELVQAADALESPDSVVLLTRHARAGKRSLWKGDDRDRPLDREGRRQARGLVPFARCFGARTDGVAVASVDIVRCRQTAAPLADDLDAAVTLLPQLSDAAAGEDPQRAVATVLDVAASAPVSVVCSQGSAIPAVLDALDVPGPHPCRKGSTWALLLRDGRLIAADYYPRPAGRRPTS